MHVQGAALLEEQQYIPDFVLDVRSVVGSQVRAEDRQSLRRVEGGLFCLGTDC